MGTLSPPFILCPLSDRKELLGMSEDGLDNRVIITIGKNIAIRYHISEQKQETSWTISRHWLTSRVVYCSDLKKYGAVIDYSTVALWDETETALNRFEKQKFTEPVFELKPTQSLGTLLVFENGFVTSLKLGKGNRNIAEAKGILDRDSEIILDFQVNEEEEQVILVIGKKTGDKQKTAREVQKRKYLKVIVVKIFSGESDTFQTESEFEISQDQKLEIVGHCILPTSDNVSILYLCSNGKLYQQLLARTESKPERSTVLGRLGKNVSVKTPVVMKFIDNGSTLIVYGSDPSEEGAVVFLYDVKYDIVLAKQSLKLYGTPPIMEAIGGNVIVPVGMHILVLGFRASKSLLSSVVGKHQVRSGEEVFEQRNPWTVAAPEWDVDKDAIHKNAIQKQKKKLEAEKKRELSLIKETFPDCWQIVQQYKILEREGQPESSICNQVIPMALEQNNLSGIDWILEAFTDIPENYLIIILSHFLNQLPEPRVVKKKVLSEKTSSGAGDEVEVDELVFDADCRINRLILRSFDERELIRNLPWLEYERVRQFIRYLKSMLDQFWPSPLSKLVDSTGTSSSKVEGDPTCWMKWISALLDAHYPKFVLNDEVALIDEMLGILEQKSKVMDAIEELEPYLMLTYNKVKFEPSPNPNNKWRSEIITFN